MANTSNQQVITNDILRYKLNKFASTLALASIVFNALYFCMLYGFTTEFFSSWKIGISVILTLVTLLITFLASEGIKNYNKKYAIVLIILAVVQIVRMFGLPLEALRSEGGLEGVYFYVTIKPSLAYTLLLVWLGLSAFALVASAAIGYINCLRLESHNKKVENGEVDIDATLREMDEEDERQAVNIVSEANVSEREIELIKEDENA